LIELLSISKCVPQVEDASRLRVGEYYETWWSDVGGKFNNAM
jgi:hypothetical protein